jgi:hypothetical protein
MLENQRVGWFIVHGQAEARPSPGPSSGSVDSYGETLGAGDDGKEPHFFKKK